MKRPEIRKEKVETLYDARFLKLYDLNYAEGKHYFDATRRNKEDIVAVMQDEEFKKMLPDAVTIAVVINLPKEEPKLLLQYEYRYPVGQFLLSPVAGLIDPEDRENDFEKALFCAAKREIKEETGIDIKESDELKILNPCAFSSPGMTDESNAFLMAKVNLENLDCLDQSGAVGSELFNGFELLSKEEAACLFKSGTDKYGNRFSLATWAVLAFFII